MDKNKEIIESMRARRIKQSSVLYFDTQKRIKELTPLINNEVKGSDRHTQLFEERKNISHELMLLLQKELFQVFLQKVMGFLIQLYQWRSLKESHRAQPHHRVVCSIL